MNYQLKLQKTLRLLKSNQPYAVIHKKLASDPQQKAYSLCWKFNRTDPSDLYNRGLLLWKIFHCHKHIMANSPFHVDYGFNVHFKGFAFFNYNDSIIDTSPIHIGKSLMVAPNVCISCSGHPINYKQRANGTMVSKPINIGDYVWIGANSFVEGGVTIGSHSVIGAGSIVTRNIPSDVVAFGSPCKVYRKITDRDMLRNIIGNKNK